MTKVQTHAETRVSLSVPPWERDKGDPAPAVKPKRTPRTDRLLLALTTEWQSRTTIYRAADAGATRESFADIDLMVEQGLAEVWDDTRTKQHIRRYRLTAKGAKAQTSAPGGD